MGSFFYYGRKYNLIKINYKLKKCLNHNDGKNYPELILILVSDE